MTDSTDPFKGLTYEERQAWPVMRRLIKRRPETAALLLDGMTKEVATAVLLKVRDELDILLKVSKVFSAAAGELTRKLEAEHGVPQ